MTTATAKAPETEEEGEYDRVKKEVLEAVKDDEDTLALIETLVIPLIEASSQQTIDDFREFAFDPVLKLARDLWDHTENCMEAAKEWATVAVQFGVAAGFIDEETGPTSDCPPPLTKALELMKKKGEILGKKHDEFAKAISELDTDQSGDEP